MSLYNSPSNEIISKWRCTFVNHEGRLCRKQAIWGCKLCFNEAGCIEHCQTLDIHLSRRFMYKPCFACLNDLSNLYERPVTRSMSRN